MSRILVFAEHTNGKLKKGTLELLAAAKASGSEIFALALGPNSDQLADQCGQHGAKKLIVCNDEKLTDYNSELFSETIYQVIKKNEPAIVLAPSSMAGRDVFPRVAAKLGTGMASDCTELSIAGENVTTRKPLYAGRCSAEVDFAQSPVKIVLMRANQLPVGAPDGSAKAEVETFTLPTLDLKTLVKEIVRGASEKVDLTEANIIVSGGRGLKSAENFKMLEELADVLGATVGASRAVCDADWVPHSMQVGQTGKTVAPSLYIACGISGAIQHLAGMSASKVIVAINNDPEAPIFQKSTYGIVGDVFEVVPKLTEEFKAILSH